MSAGGRPAILLDRDGTLVEDPGYLRDPATVRLLPGAAAALARLAEAGYALVIITNQSGIARGKLSRDDYLRVTARLEALLAAEGVRLDGTYMCPHAPERDGPCACRKPGVELFRQAERDLALDLSRSVCIGDRISDLEPAQALGGRGILVLTGEGAAHREAARAAGFEVVETLAGAAALLLAAPGQPG